MENPFSPFERNYWITKAVGWSIRKFQSVTANPEGAQAAALKKLIKLNRESQVGRDLGFDKVNSAEDMRSLKVSTQEDMQPYFEKCLALGRDAQGIFGTTPLVALMRTTGTTAAPKHIPANQAYLRAYQRSRFFTFGSIAYGSPQQWHKILTHPYLVMSSSPPIEMAPGNLPMGFGSGVLTELSKPYGKVTSYPKLSTRQMSDWLKKAETIYDETVDKDISSIMGFPRYIEDLTEYVLQRSGAKHLREIWPNLFLIVSGAVKMSEPLKIKVAEQWAGPGARFGKDLHFCDVFSATEGQFGMSWNANGGDLTLDPMDNFYQFRDPDTGSIHQIGDVALNHPYELVVTTPGGLINYTLGDVIQFTSLAPPRFEICGRVRDEISLAGEKITPGNVEKAHEILQARYGVGIVDFAVWIEESPRRMHWVLCKPEKGPIPTPEQLDETLAEIAVYYKVLLKDKFYHPCVIEWVDKDFFRRYRARHAHRGQFKGKRLFIKQSDFTKEYGDSTPKI